MLIHVPKILDIVQGSDEWLELRSKKITATDASVIMGVNPWKTKGKLLIEKLSPLKKQPRNLAMQRAIDLEPTARDLFVVLTGIEVYPQVVLHPELDWMMASLDGISECGKHLVEIKCPGPKDHNVALSGNIPANYYPQVQHQMYVCGVQFAYYFSFDGRDGVIVNISRNEEYITKMLQEEMRFYEELMAS